MNRRGGQFSFSGPAGTVTIGPPGPVPPAVRWLIIFNIGIFVVQLLLNRPGGLPYFLERQLALIPNTLPLEAWRLFTYQFLHGGVFHVCMNMLMLWMFGSELEQRMGLRFFLKYYFICAVGGALTYSIFNLGSATPTIGASGAIFGILMAYGLWFPNRVVLLGFIFPVRIRHMMVMLIGMQCLLAMDASILSATGESRTSIAYLAHLGGMAFGYAYLRWWNVGGFGSGADLSVARLKRSYNLWRLKRLQKKRFGGQPPSPDDPPTYH